MSREIKEDLTLLRSFISAYSLDSLSKHGDFEKHLKQQHGRYLSLLVFLAELQEQIAAAKHSGIGIDHLPSDLQISYLCESASDIGQSVFCWINGAYKAARVMVRSSIETFVKGIACADQPTVLTEKSVYKVFDTAALATFFSNPSGDVLLKQLNSKYGELCGDVHTAVSANMNHISALNYFPTFDAKRARATSDVIIFVATQQVAALSLAFNQGFHAMHHRNKETILENIPATWKSRVQNMTA